jgi:manganese/zinc/iron transport system permease protein
MTSSFAPQFLPALSADDLWSIAILSLASVSVGLIGVHLFLRRLSLMGDALGHAVLPGVVAGVVLLGSTSSGVVVLGAMTAAILSVGMMRILSASGLTPEAALGATFTTFFACGVIGINVFGGQIDLDPGCLLYGSLELAPLDTVVLAAGLEVPRATLSCAITLAFVVLVLVAQRRGLSVISMDPERATVMSSKTRLFSLELVFLAAAASAVVNSFFAVGAIATTGMLVSPALVARLFSSSMVGVWWATLITSLLTALVGYVAAVALDIPVAGAVASTGFALALIAILVSPVGGVLPEAISGLILRIKVRGDDLLANQYRRLEDELEYTSRVNPGGSFKDSLVSFWLTMTGFLSWSGELTNRGLERAQVLIRSHRVWEDYLSRRLNVPADHVHDPSHLMEHFLSPELANAVAERNASDTDPHGRRIPPATKSVTRGK